MCYNITQPLSHSRICALALMAQWNCLFQFVFVSGSNLNSRSVCPASLQHAYCRMFSRILLQLAHCRRIAGGVVSLKLEVLGPLTNSSSQPQRQTGLQQRFKSTANRSASPYFWMAYLKRGLLSRIGCFMARHLK